MKLVSMLRLSAFPFGLGLFTPDWLSTKLGMSTACKEEASVWLGSSISSTWLANSSGLTIKLDLCDCFEFFWLVSGVDISLASPLGIDKDLKYKCRLSKGM